MNLILKVAAVVALALASGCATVPLADNKLDVEAKYFQPTDQKANVYIFRDQRLGGGLRLAVSVNDKVLGQTAPKTYFFLQLNPGRYVFKAMAENVAQLPLVVEAGQNYFIRQQIDWGTVIADNTLVLVDDAEGKAAVREAGLIQTSVSGSQLSPEGAADLTAPGSLTERLAELDALRASGAITAEEHEAGRRRVLEDI